MDDSPKNSIPIISSRLQSLPNSGERWIFNVKNNTSNSHRSLLDYDINDYPGFDPQLRQSLSQKKVPLFKLVKGIQTGKDSVFVVRKEVASNWEQEKIRPFIKGQHILPFILLPTDRMIILSHRYSPIIGNEVNEIPRYPQISHYLVTHQKELSGRSRAQGDLWSYWRRGDEREGVDFDIPKVVWPYRGERLRAAIDWGGSYHSQDVILLTLNTKELVKCLSKDDFQSLLRDWQENGLYFYIALFNSDVGQQLLMHTAKEFAQNVKDFQPNNFTTVGFPCWDATNNIHQQIITTTKSLCARITDWISNGNIYSDYHFDDNISRKLDALIATILQKT
jgi:hypothetical protein